MLILWYGQLFREIFMVYVYETHLHTRDTSKCGKTYARDYIDFMIGRGYAGMIVTDHFFRNNTRIDESLEWKTKIDLFAKGYEEALQAAEGKDFTVMFGLEFKFESDEYLIYGISPQWLKEHEEIMDISRSEVYRLVHEAGAIMVQAHPYRERKYVHKITLCPSIADGIEIFNAGNERYMDALAAEYAKTLNVPLSAGSDIHYLNDRPMGGIAFDRPLHTIDEFVKAFLNHEGIPVVMDGDKLIPTDQIAEIHTVTRMPSTPVVYAAD